MACLPVRIASACAAPADEESASVLKEKTIAPCPVVDYTKKCKFEMYFGEGQGMSSYVVSPRKRSLGRRILQHWPLYALLLPAVLVTLLFNYYPLYGVQLAFKNMKLGQSMSAAPWVGLQNFRRFFTAGYFERTLVNTLMLSLLTQLTFPLPIILALLLHNCVNRHIKKGAQMLTYIPNLVSVAGEAGSEDSKDLRKAFMTLLSVYRDTVVNSYYGDRAAVIQYPISNTSWAAPRPTDEGYENCYSRDVDGNPIYTEGMSDEQKYDAALTAAIGYLKAAGFTWDDAAGKFTAAPEGASLSYEVMIPGQGIGDHPAYGVAVAASEQLAKIGITMQVNDVGTSVWNNALESNTAQMWAAAWQATADPDMYQVYHSSNANGQNTNSNHYQIVSDELDELIMAGRTSPDTDFRKATYKSAMEEILDWGVELPLYQRKDAIVASTIRIDTETLPKDMTPYWGWTAEINTLAVK